MRMKLTDLTPDDIVYISGPMTGLPAFNKPLFRIVEAKLRIAVGCEVLNPARHPDGLKHSEYMRLAGRDLQEATAVVFLPGYQASQGAMWELATAKIYDIPRCYEMCQGVQDAAAYMMEAAYG